MNKSVRTPKRRMHLPSPAKTKPFDRGWQEWLASNLMQGVVAEKILSVMVRNGFERDFSSREIKSAKINPYVIAGEKIFRSKKKLASLFDAFGAQFRQSGQAQEPLKVTRITPTEFYSKYYYGNRPVVIPGLMQDWKALRLWSPNYFRREFGDIEIEVTADRNKDLRYEDNFMRHRSKMFMKDFVRKVEEGGETNDYYLVAKNFLLSQKEFRVLRTHFTSPKGFLDPAILTDRHVKLWFGPAGTVTPLHHDGSNIFFAQVYGRKHVKLIPPFDIGYVYNDRECFSPVNMDYIDYERFPLMSQASIIDVVLEPGDFLLFPIGWWHWVKALDTSISLSFSNFITNGPNVVWTHRY